MRRLLVGVVCVAILLLAVSTASAQAPDYNSGPAPVLDPKAPVIRPGHGTFLAVINADGTIASHKKAISSTWLGTGVYEVLFTNNIRPCSYTATAGETDALGTTPAAVVTVAGRFSDVRGVFVAIYDLTGGMVDSPFHLTVVCK